MMTDVFARWLAGNQWLLAQSAPPETHRSLLDYIQDGGLLSYVMVLLSILALALMIGNLITLRIEHLMPARVIAGLERLLRERNAEGVFAYAREKDNDRFITRVVAGALAKVVRSQFGLLEFKPALEEVAAKELDRLDRPTHGLALLAAIGPMLGLLGTVIAMILAFSALGNEQGAARSARLASEMSRALVNTAEGLVLAIPCTVAYSLFRRRTDRLMAQVSDAAERLAAVLQAAQSAATQQRAAGAGAARPAGPAAAPSNASNPGPTVAGVPPVGGLPLPPAAPRPPVPTGPA